MSLDEYNPKHVYRFASRGDRDKLLQALQIGNNHTNWYRDEDYGYTALHKAVEKDRTKCIGILIDGGADVESKDNEGKTALHTSVEMYTLFNSGPRTMLELLNRGADIESKDNNGRTALMNAIVEELEEEYDRDKQLMCIWNLLNRVADIENKDKNGDTALALASIYGIDTYINLLLDRGANVENKNINGRTPLGAAVINNNLRCVRMLLLDGCADIESKDHDGFRAIQLAAFKGDLKCVVILCNAGADLNSKSNDGYTASYLAAKKGHAQCLKVLTERGADTNIKSNNHFTPLHIAAYRGHSECIRVLAATCLDFNVETDGLHQKTALHLAAMNGHVECIDLLLSYGADIDSFAFLLMTPMYTAAGEGRNECVRLLLDRGASINMEFKVMFESLENQECKQMIFDEIQNRLRREAFDSFIAHHIKYPPLINNIFSTCYPSGDLRVASPAIGWDRAEEVRNKYYFDEVLFYVHLFVANELAKKLPHKRTRSSSRRCSNIISCLAKNSDDTSTLMIVLSDRLKMYLKPLIWT